MAHLTISPADYRILLEMINLATYVAQNHGRGGREDWLNSFDALSDKVLAMATEMGCGDLVEKDPESGHWLPVEDYETESFFKECADDMIEQCFWEDLVSRLSDRDLARTMTSQQWESLSEKERVRRREARDKIYWKEFETRGVENLECIHRQPHG